MDILVENLWCYKKTDTSQSTDSSFSFIFAAYGKIY